MYPHVTPDGARTHAVPHHHRSHGLHRPRVLVTGSRGLVGTALSSALEAGGYEVVRFDIRSEPGDGHGDTRISSSIREAVRGVDGVVHLAAVARVVWAERDPEQCEETNVVGTKNVIDAALAEGTRPWVIFASSREVYGQAGELPADEDAPLAPVNVYGRSKVAGERLVTAARDNGARTAIVRLSNVYGSLDDHVDRVIPAFVRAAIGGGTLRVEGVNNTFDFVHIDDVTRGLLALVEEMQTRSDAPPPIHLVTGVPTTLRELAHRVVAITGSRAAVRESTPRTFDVSRFYGDPSRARKLLGWSARISLDEGLRRLAEEHGFATVISSTEEVAP